MGLQQRHRLLRLRKSEALQPGRLVVTISEPMSDREEHAALEKRVERLEKLLQGTIIRKPMTGKDILYGALIGSALGLGAIGVGCQIL